MALMNGLVIWSSPRLLLALVSFASTVINPSVNADATISMAKL